MRSTLSEAGRPGVVIEGAKPGRKNGKQCKAGRRTGKECNALSKVASDSAAAPAGAATVALPKRKPARGAYRLVVTPVDAAGHRGAARIVTFKIK